MAFGDTKIVINSITYEKKSGANNLLVGVRKHPETEDSQTADVVLNNADARFSALNLKGLTAVISYDRGSGYVATPTLTVITQDDITSNGQYQTVLSLIGFPDLLAQDKASAEYLNAPTNTKTVKALITETLTDTAVASTVTVSQETNNAFFNMYEGSIVLVGQLLKISNTVTSLQFLLKKVGSPTGNITFYMRASNESFIERKVLADASTLTTNSAYYEATFDTPKVVDEDVFIYCEFVSGDSSNYISIGYNDNVVSESDPEPSQHLALRYLSGEWLIYSSLDCNYKYSYSDAGIGVFSHTTSYTATFDSESSLMDTYQPRDSFKISEGESRLDVVNKLLDYVSDLKRFESDGQPHFFTTPSSGNEYTSDKGEFYTHANSKSLVVPNKIVVKSVDFETDGFTGSATSAASFALKPITGSPVRAYVTGNAQAQSVAEATIARLEINAQVGSSLVRMTNYEQVWNFVTVTNNWNGSTTTGNIAYLNRVSINGQFNLFVAFGRQARKGLAGFSLRQASPSLQQFIEDEATLKWGNIKTLFEIIDENTDEIFFRLNFIVDTLEGLGVKVDGINADLSESIDDAIENDIETLKLYIDAVVERLHVTKELIGPVRATIAES